MDEQRCESVRVDAGRSTVDDVVVSAHEHRSLCVMIAQHGGVHLFEGHDVPRDHESAARWR